MRASLVSALRWILGGLMIFAAVLKLADPGAFFQSVQNYRLLPESLAYATALYLPWLEVTLGGAVALGLATREALAVLAALLLAFCGALVSAQLRGLNIDCGCFGRESSDIGLALLRNLGLLAVSLGLFLAEKADAAS